MSNCVSSRRYNVSPSSNMTATFKKQTTKDKLSACKHAWLVYPRQSLEILMHKRWDHLGDMQIKYIFDRLRVRQISCTKLKLNCGDFLLCPLNFSLSCFFAIKQINKQKPLEMSMFRYSTVVEIVAHVASIWYTSREPLPQHSGKRQRRRRCCDDVAVDFLSPSLHTMNSHV